MSNVFAVNLTRLFASSAVALGLTITSANALTIDDTFESSLTSSPNAAALESAIDQASNTIAALYSNPITVNILFGYSSSVHGQSQTGYYQTSYSSYANLLTANATANPANTVLSTAVANLGNGNGAAGLPIFSTPANLRALGVTTATGFYNSNGTFIASGGQKYDGVVTIGNLSTASNGPGYNSQAVSIAEHQINEILGGGGAGSTLGTSNQSLGFGGLDLYRYQSNGSTIAGVTSIPSFTTSASAVVAFSVDGGQTALAQFNQAGGGSDYGDFAFTGTPEIQGAFDSGPTKLYTTSSVEYATMESIGYDPVTVTPLPSTWLMLLSGLVGFGFFAYRGSKDNASAIAAT